MKKDKSIKLNAIRKKIDQIDDKILKLVAQRFNEIHKVANLKDDPNQVVDHERIKKFFKTYKLKLKKRN